MLKRNLVVIGFAILSLIFVSNTFGQTPGVRKVTIKKPKVNSQSLQQDDVNSDNESTVKRKPVKNTATPNSSPISGDIRTKANRRKFDHIGNINGSAEETNRNRKPKAEKFAGTILEGSNIHRKQPKRKRNK